MKSNLSTSTLFRPHITGIHHIGHRNLKLRGVILAVQELSSEKGFGPRRAGIGIYYRGTETTVGVTKNRAVMFNELIFGTMIKMDQK